MVSVMSQAPSIEGEGLLQGGDIPILATTNTTP